jgi:hypothetical protein
MRIKKQVIAELKGEADGSFSTGASSTWVNEPVEDRGQRDLRHPPLDKARREILRRIKKSLDEVYPLTLAEWELSFRYKTEMEYALASWRRLAHTYGRLTDPRAWRKFNLAPPLPLKRDLFRLLFAWMNTRDVEQALATTLPLNEIPEEAARQILANLKFVATDWFGGRCAQLFKRLRMNASMQSTQIPPMVWGIGKTGISFHILDMPESAESGSFLIDFAALKSPEEFKAQADPADIIVAVDWATGDTQVVFGVDTLQNMGETASFQFLGFAVDFESDSLERLLGAVRATKGHCYYNLQRSEGPQ